MGELEIEVWDATGNKRVQVQVPDDVPVDRILIVLIEKLRLPRLGVDGQILSYKLHHRRLGVQLLGEKTFGEQAVQSGDIIRLQPEITAGACADVHADLG